MKKPPLNYLFVYTGVCFLLMGLILRTVDSFVLSSGATKVLANLTGPPADTPEGAVQKIIVETTSPRKTITPPSWLGWAFLSVGFILTAHGLLQIRRKRS